MKFRKKPDTRTFEPEQFLTFADGTPVKRIRGVCLGGAGCDDVELREIPARKPHVHTIHKGQTVLLEDRDWVMPEPDGIHFYPIKPGIFDATYEVAD